MFSSEQLEKLDSKYFNVILVSDYDITIQSRNTGHWWYLHCTDYPNEGNLLLYHKHEYRHPYHQHSRERSLRRAVRNIKSHDKWLLRNTV